ncbi:MAG: diaminopimelate decarboxylase [Alphaproteobacteria bacterium]|nr:diaminopimelate decarboxylase [Alphaproteobacteria bacterium]
MNHFDYRGGILCAEDVPLPEIARAVGTPFYCYSTATLERHYRVFEAAMPPGTLVAYAVKANGNLSVIKTLAKLGAGADIVSVGELQRVMAGGVPPSKIVFSGVGKKRAEIAAALDAGIFQFNVESEPELDVINEIALAKGQRAAVALRINPDVDARTHAKISTGKAENKFGIGWSRAQAAYAYAAKLPGLDVAGVAVHIGSQITELEPFRQTFSKVADLVRILRAAGHKISRVDLGGGLGVPYKTGMAPPDPSSYGELVRAAVDGLDVQLTVEPGRLITANAGVLIAEVIYVKQGDEKAFVILDAGMNDLIRPAMYEAWHDIVPVRQPAQGVQRRVYDVVGPVCESADLFARDRELPALSAGDLVAILSTGAYGAVQASGYNARPLAPEILVRGRQFAVTRPRESVEETIARERWPEWLA